MVDDIGKTPETAIGVAARRLSADTGRSGARCGDHRTSSKSPDVHVLSNHGPAARRGAATRSSPCRAWSAPNCVPVPPGHDCLLVTGGKRAANSSTDNLICSYVTTDVAWPMDPGPQSRGNKVLADGLQERPGHPPNYVAPAIEFLCRRLLVPPPFSPGGWRDLLFVVSVACLSG